MAQGEPFGAKIIPKCILWVRGLVPFWVLRHSFLSLSHFTISYISCWYTVSGYPGENKLTLLTNPVLYFLIIKTNCFSNIMINKPIRNLDSSLNTHCVFHLCVPAATAAAAKSLQSCPTLCDPMDSSPPGSSIPGILQARTLEWVAISFSSA